MSAPYRIQHHAQPEQVTLADTSGTSDGVSEYLSRLTKLIPAEVLALYLTGQNVIPSGEDRALVLWSALCLVGVFAVRVYGTRDPVQAKPPQWPTVIIACVSFVIWLYSMGGPFAALGVHVPYVASLLVLAWTFFVPILYRGEAV